MKVGEDVSKLAGRIRWVPLSATARNMIRVIAAGPRAVLAGPTFNFVCLCKEGLRQSGD